MASGLIAVNGTGRALNGNESFEKMTQSKLGERTSLESDRIWTICICLIDYHFLQKS